MRQTVELLNIPLRNFKNIGPKASNLLNKLALRTFGDILYHIPIKYLDFSSIKPINSIKIGEEVTVSGEIISSKVNKHSKISTVTCIVKDETSLLSAIWFNQPYLAKTLKEGSKVFLSGQLVKKFGRMQMENPAYEVSAENETDLIHTGRIVPVHPATAGLSQRQIRSIVKKGLSLIDDLEDPLGPYLPQSMPALAEAIKRMHFPEEQNDSEKAMERFAWEELFYFFLMQRMIRSNKRRIAGIRHHDKDLVGLAESALPFDLTGQQKKCLKSVFIDMEESYAMDRVVQGDVGSGKTVVAFLAMLKAAGSGRQSVLMAPTEILAEQHFKKFNSFFGDLAVSSVLVTGSTNPARKKKYLEAISSGEYKVIIGTHALIQQAIQYKNLSLVVIDEQHRFGVAQREVLKTKSEITPDYLMLSATPIPRTMFSVVYGDLDVNIIDEFPSNKRLVETYVKPLSGENEVIDKVKSAIQKTRQAFIVCPVIEETANLELQAVENELNRWAKALYPFRIGKIHGKMAPNDKQSVMEDFAKGFLDVLICTSVIEVGIDVPNATIMVINNADRFGLAQLHQMRGRIGRGGDRSHCYLLHEGNSTSAHSRLEALKEHNDGFKLSEIDLQLRGEGEILGFRQWGKNQFKFVDFSRHDKQVKEVKELVAKEFNDFAAKQNGPVLCELKRRYPAHKELFESFEDNSGQV